MKRRSVVFITALVVMSAYSGLGSTPKKGAAKPLPKNAKVVFLHHSTGSKIWQGGGNGSVKDWFENYNRTHSTAYTIEERSYPSSGAGNYGWSNAPYDYWNIWVRNGNKAQFKNQDTLKVLTKKYDVIVWKHCYPVSEVVPADKYPSVDSERQTLENLKLQYNALKKKMRAYPNTRFIIWTPSAKVQKATTAGNAQRAKAFSEWIVNTWDEKGDNIYIWEFRSLETGGTGLYLLPKNSTASDSWNTSPRKDSDSHPGEDFAKIAAPKFAQRVVAVIEGRGDTGSILGK